MSTQDVDGGGATAGGDVATVTTPHVSGKSTRKQLLKHVLSVLDFTEIQQDEIYSCGITSIGNLVKTTDDDWNRILEKDNNTLETYHTNRLRSFCIWYALWIKNGGSLSLLEYDFTEEEWDTWIPPVLEQAATGGRSNNTDDLGDRTDDHRRAGIDEESLAALIRATDDKERNTSGYAKRTLTEYVERVELLLGITLRNYDSPMQGNYHPELDDSPHLDIEGQSRYRMLIGCANWTITLGRFDVYYATQTLARYMAHPREGQYKELLRLMGYLKHHRKGQILLDTQPFIPTWTSESTVQEVDVSVWREFYAGATEEIPDDAPKPKGEAVTTTIFFDADHASDLETRRSVTGILFFVNNTPIRWYSKRQATVESSSYGSELVAARIATEMAIEMRHKLRMLGVKLDGPTIMYGDNKSVVTNLSVPSSVLKKKHNAIAYHKVRQCVAAGIVKLYHMPGKDNPADVLTKAVELGTFKKLVRPLLFRSVLDRGECQDTKGLKDIRKDKGRKGKTGAKGQPTTLHGGHPLK